jgi:hypothetical protein
VDADFLEPELQEYLDKMYPAASHVDKVHCDGFLLKMFEGVCGAGMAVAVSKGWNSATLRRWQQTELVLGNVLLLLLDFKRNPVRPTSQDQPVR